MINRKLNIAFVGSIRNHFIDPYMKSMTELGHSVVLYNIDVKESCKNEMHGRVIDVSCGVDARRGITKWRYGIAALRLRDMLAKYPPDILHAHYGSSAGLVCFLTGFRPYIVSIRGSDVLIRSKSLIWRHILGLVLRRSQLVHAVSDELEARARALANSNHLSIRTLTQGIDVKRFHFRQRPNIGYPLRILCTRTMDRNYSNDTIVDACAILRDMNCPFQLTFAADGPLCDEVEERVMHKGILDKVKFLKGYDNSLLPDILNDHDIYVSASRSDGTSVSLLEAMSSGLLPVVSRIKSNNSWLEDGKTCLMFDCGDAQELAYAFRSAATSNKDWRSQALIANRDRVERDADRSVNMLLLEQWYYELVNRMS